MPILMNPEYVRGRPTPRAMLRAAKMQGSPWRKLVLRHFTLQKRAVTRREMFELLVRNGEPVHISTLYRVIQDLAQGGLLTCEVRGNTRTYRAGAIR